MAVLAVFGVLIAAAIAITSSQATRMKVGRAWFTALAGSLLAWLILFFMRLYLPTDVPLLVWKPENLFFAFPALVLDYSNWPYAVAMLTICMAVLFTDSTRAQLAEAPLGWAGTLAITAINLAAILAGNPFTMALAWGLVDLVELVHLLRVRSVSLDNTHIVSVYGLRLASTFALVAATVIGWQVKPQFLLNEIPANAGLYFLAAAGLRLGVLPLHLPFLDTPELRRSSGLVFRFAPVASALVLIAWLPADFLVLRQYWITIIQVLAVIAAVYTSGMWLTRKDAYEGRPYWIAALSAFAVQCALNNQAGASRVWGLALILSGGLLFLFDPPIRRIRFLMAFGLWGLVALPFTPAAGGWDGLVGQGISAAGFFMIISHAMLVLGYLRFIYEGNSTITGLEKHARVTYPLGLILVGQTIVVLGLMAWPGILTLGRWWASVASLAVVLLGGFAFLKLGARRSLASLAETMPGYRAVSAFLTGMSSLLSMRWLFSMFGWIFERVEKGAGYLTNILEGAGGVLWSVVLLIAMIMLFLARVAVP